jgi:hypothetical protein
MRQVNLNWLRRTHLLYANGWLSSGPFQHYYSKWTILEINLVINRRHKFQPISYAQLLPIFSSTGTESIGKPSLNRVNSPLFSRLKDQHDVRVVFLLAVQPESKLHSKFYSQMDGIFRWEFVKHLSKFRGKVKQSRYTPWRRLGGEEV